MTKRILDDQTDFAQQAPLLEQVEDQWWQSTDKSRIKTDQKFLETKKGKLILIFGFLSIVLIAFIIILILIKQQMNQGEGFSILPQPKGDKDLTPLQQQIVDLRLQLKTADPAIKETPFPRIDMEISVSSE
jgi:hypothetical protein